VQPHAASASIATGPNLAPDPKSYPHLGSSRGIACEMSQFGKKMSQLTGKFEEFPGNG
jgi:hypothetical protein